VLNVKKIVILVQILNVLNAKLVIIYNHNNVPNVINLVRNVQLKLHVKNVIMGIILMLTNVLVVLQIVIHAQMINVLLVVKVTH